MQFGKSKETMNVGLIALLGLSNNLQRKQSLVKDGFVSKAPNWKVDNPEHSFEKQFSPITRLCCRCSWFTAQLCVQLNQLLL
jgi:hypothetical protein